MHPPTHPMIHHNQCMSKATKCVDIFAYTNLNVGSPTQLLFTRTTMHIGALIHSKRGFRKVLISFGGFFVHNIVKMVICMWMTMLFEHKGTTLVHENEDAHRCFDTFETSLPESPHILWWFFSFTTSLKMVIRMWMPMLFGHKGESGASRP